ncbi:MULTISPECIES: tryptophan--tRNA ligase [Moraxella]|uniref:Tryptophan--tRNA ligase n=1 Tax=Moraxella lacunata TaxID=477 RepID=A0A1B8PX42_MORLA|nr:MULTISPECIES: tryptophan--tRNA ligase [Moraxella]MBE9578916.1 tryptophan--tRNA ligase [Moraxella sp. K1664]MBE9588260.1 tryptophan--tRNA ligase [Moraxella sp. K1630]MBE9590845.1 tryptophan--tRNA ligase [Moraxella sp. K127]MBE9596366.1 tryptophan--tRNA ligase [Moraxella sp. K2450]MDH9218767.1 tryptophan--tRNA ligase [Moraxella lacunata]
MTAPTTKRILTGITTTGIPHLGNYVGAIRPAIQAVQNSDDDAFFFLADYHGIIKCFDPDEIHRSTKAIAATWIACGLDPEKVTFYRQSDIPEIPELAWILNCSCAKGLMNRAHAYKASVDMNLAKEDTDADFGISMGLFSYPVLMSADILMFNATHVPVGKDQIQHIEMARDIAGTFNFKYKELFTLPTAVTDENTPLLTGLDGRKMSKSYGNTIPLFGDGSPTIDPQKALKKAIGQIVTNSQAPEEPKNPDECNIFEIYKAFATPDEINALAEHYRRGIGWGEAKEILFNKIDGEIAPMREKYAHLMANPKELEEILQMGAVKARRVAQKQLDKTRRAIGIKPLAKLK